MQKLNSALNGSLLYASHVKFVETYVKYLLSYGWLKKAPRRLKQPFSHAEAGKCAILFSPSSVFTGDGCVS